MTDQQIITAQVTKAILDLSAAGKLEKGAQIVIGCSTSEVAGGRIGKNSVPEIGEWIAAAVLHPRWSPDWLPRFSRGKSCRFTAVPGRISAPSAMRSAAASVPPGQK